MVRHNFDVFRPISCHFVWYLYTWNNYFVRKFDRDFRTIRDRDVDGKIKKWERNSRGFPEVKFCCIDQNYSSKNVFFLLIPRRNGFFLLNWKIMILILFKNRFLRNWYEGARKADFEFFAVFGCSCPRSTRIYDDVYYLLESRGCQLFVSSATDLLRSSFAPEYFVVRFTRLHKFG